MLRELREKNEETLSLQLEKRSIEAKIKELRFVIVAEKKTRPRKKCGEVLQQTENEIELNDLVHRKRLMSDRLNELSKKSTELGDVDLIEGDGQDNDEEVDEELSTLEGALTMETPPEDLTSQLNKRKPEGRSNQQQKKKKK